MRPIVNGLEEQFGDRMAFVYTNAATDGQEAFEALSLPGHPSYVIFNADNEEVYRTFGVVEEAQLRSAITDQLDGD